MYPDLKKIIIALAAMAILAGCARLPYEPTTETSVAGAAVGATAGAVLAGDEDEVLGAILGGLAGAAAGYVIGAKTSWFAEGNEQEFNQRVNEAWNDPVSVEDVYSSYDADLNNDGLVTQEELITLAHAGLSADEIIDRLEATDQIYHVTPAQRQDLIAAGVPPQVVYELEEINRA